MKDRASRQRRETLVVWAQSTGQFLLGMGLVVLGATNFFLNGMTLVRQAGELWSQGLAWNIVAAAAIAFALSAIPFYVGYRLIRSATLNWTATSNKR